jgi:predicted enzyme related to lactoylglutathione lyase
VQERGGAFVEGPYEIPGGRWMVMADPEGNEFCLVMPGMPDAATSAGND